jgi:hypothetical protein
MAGHNRSWCGVEGPALLQGYCLNGTASILALPMFLTTLSVTVPGACVVCRCEWELDPRKVLVGRRLAVGGFAEVFLGKYEVSGGCVWQE